MPWEISLGLDNYNQYYEEEGRIKYTYSIKKELEGGVFSEKKERDPQRFINILKPQLYSGQLSEQQVMGLGQTSNDCFVVNGVLHKYDGAFFGDFHIKEFNNLNVLVGSYPICENDCN